MGKPARLFYVIYTLFEFAFTHTGGKKGDATVGLFERFSKLGGIYIKFLQLLAVREGIDDARFKKLEDILAVFDDAPREHIDVTKVLYQQLGSKASQLILESDKPFAAGSFGQIYKASLVSGEKVIVKVLRPSVTKNLAFDLRVLGFVVSLLGVTRANDMIDAKSAFADIRELTMRETDYIHEGRNAEQMRRQFEGNNTIIIPRTYLELSSRSILIQNEVEGVSLSSLLEKASNIRSYISQEYGTNLDYVMEELAYQTLHANLTGKISHGDPHPGNIYILPDNRIALIDFGIENKPIKRKKELLNLISSYVDVYDGNFDPEKLTEKMMNFFIPDLLRALNIVGSTSGIDIRKKVLGVITATAKDTIENGSNKYYADDLLANYKMVNIFTEVVNQNNRFGIKADLESVALMRSTSIYLNVLKKIGCTKDVVSAAYKRILITHGKEHQVDEVKFDSESLDESFHMVSNWLDRLRYSDPISYIKLQEMMV